MINLEYIGQNIVENMVSVRNREIKEGSAIIISFEYNFMEWFKAPLFKEQEKQLKADFPTLIIKSDGIEAKLFINLLFIKRGGYYSCFIQDSDSIRSPLMKNETEWGFTTNHDSCWRTTAFDKANQVLSNIRQDISKISNLSEVLEIENISIPKHVIPNFAIVKNRCIYFRRIRNR